MTRANPWHLFRVICIGVLLFYAPPSKAQSSVSLYGVVDEGIDYTNNAGGHSAWMMQSGDLQGARWGLLGSEDLGAGHQAVFRLESGFNLSNGMLAQGGRMFGSQAYMGLQDKTYGSVTMGRQYDAFVDFVSPVTANGNWGGGAFAHLYDNDNSGSSFRLNNAVKYTSIDYAGFSFGGTYAFSQQAGGFAQDRAYSLGAQYVHGPFTGALAYLQANGAGSRMDGALASHDANFVAGRTRIWGTGFLYQIAAATLGLVYTHSDFQQAQANNDLGQFTPDAASGFTSGFTSGFPSLKFDNYEVNARYAWTPDFGTGLMYLYTVAHVDAQTGRFSPKWHQGALIADYSLSKRTLVYAQASYQRACGDRSQTGFDNALISGSAGLSSSQTQVFARLGVRHLF